MGRSESSVCWPWCSAGIFFRWFPGRTIDLINLGSRFLLRLHPRRLATVAEPFYFLVISSAVVTGSCLEMICTSIPFNMDTHNHLWAPRTVVAIYVWRETKRSFNKTWGRQPAHPHLYAMLLFLLALVNNRNSACFGTPSVSPKVRLGGRASTAWASPLPEVRLCRSKKKKDIERHFVQVLCEDTCFYRRLEGLWLRDHKIEWLLNFWCKVTWTFSTCLLNRLNKSVHRTTGCRCSYVYKMPAIVHLQWHWIFSWQTTKHTGKHLQASS